MVMTMSVLTSSVVVLPCCRLSTGCQSLLFFGFTFLLFSEWNLGMGSVRETSISSPVIASAVADMFSLVAVTWEFWEQLQFSDWFLSCESIVEPMSGIHSLIRKWPYKEAWNWSRHVSVASSLKGGDSLLRPLHIIYWVTVHLKGVPISHRLLTCCWWLPCFLG